MYQEVTIVQISRSRYNTCHHDWGSDTKFPEGRCMWRLQNMRGKKGVFFKLRILINALTQYNLM